MLKLVAALVASALILAFFAEVRKASERSYTASQHYAAADKRHGSERNAAQEQEDGTLAYYTYWLTFFTGVLALATIGLGGATLGLYFAGERQLKLAKETSERQATEIQSQIALARDEFIAAHRREIRIKHVQLARDIWDGVPLVVNLTCVNSGTSNAIVGQVGIKYFVVRKGVTLPLETAITSVLNLPGLEMRVGRNYTFDQLATSALFSAQENSDIHGRRADLYCVGYVSYVDGADRMRITGFCRILTFDGTIADVAHSRFRTRPDPDYEYQD